MLFTAKQALEIEKNLEKVKFRFVGKEKEFFEVLKDCSEEEKICMSYLYCFMPISDIANYEGNLIFKFVRAALKAKALLPWGKDLSTEFFLHYVAAYRVNNENIEDYREQFFEELYPRVKDKTIKEAVIETNYWCLEKATYQSTDIRTASPLTVLKNAYGRCGEESTLLVSALRSIGIPARQCYAPKWAHCDDNHAWVEVWIENEWHYMGACEPEPRLDTGWFDWAASRAMLTEVKAFGAKAVSEDVMDQSEIVSNINTLEYYAKTKVITVEVKDNQDKPVKGASVRFELVNYAELYPIATQITDDRGRVSFKTGYGDLMLHIHKDGKFVIQKVDVREVEYIQVDWSDAQSYQVTNYAFDMVPPMVEVEEVPGLTAEVESIHQLKMTEANEKRKRYEETFFNEKTAAEFARNYKPYEQQIAEFLIKARGNYEVIKTYIQQYGEIPLGIKILLLEHLTKKDYTDISLEGLVEHTKASLVYSKQYEKEIFGKYILAPRIDLEMIEPYKIQLLELLSQEEIERFRGNPEAIIAYIQKEIQPVGEMDYPTLQAGPVGTMKLKRGSLVAKHILFVAICRALGVPARLREVDGTVEYYQDGKWMNHTMAEFKYEVPINAKLILQKTDDREWSYATDYSLGYLVDGVYETLKFYESKWDENKISFDVRPGHYRLITANRQIDGTILANAYIFEIKDTEEKILEVKLRQGMIQKQLKTVSIEDEELDQLKAEENIVIWLDLGKEPTEHILNELREQKDSYSQVKADIVCLVEGEGIDNDPTLKKTLAVLPQIAVRKVPSMETTRTQICEAFSISKEQLPLATVITKEQQVKYACSGYNVGLAELLLKVVEALQVK